MSVSSQRSRAARGSVCRRAPSGRHKSRIPGAAQVRALQGGRVRASRYKTASRSVFLKPSPTWSSRHPCSLSPRRRNGQRNSKRPGVRPLSHLAYACATRRPAADVALTISQPSSQIRRPLIFAYIAPGSDNERFGGRAPPRDANIIRSLERCNARLRLRIIEHDRQQHRCMDRDHSGKPSPP